MFWNTQAIIKTFLPTSLPAPQANPIPECVWITRIFRAEFLKEREAVCNISSTIAYP